MKETRMPAANLVANSGNTIYRVCVIPSSNFLRPSVWPKPPIQDAPWVLILESRLLTVWSGPTWSELLWVAWDFNSPWITVPMTAHQSQACMWAIVRHITLAPTVSLCTPSAIVFVPMKVRIWHHLRRCIDGSSILLTVKIPVWPR